MTLFLTAFGIVGAAVVRGSLCLVGQRPLVLFGASSRGAGCRIG